MFYEELERKLFSDYQSILIVLCFVIISIVLIILVTNIRHWKRRRCICKLEELDAEKGYRIEPFSQQIHGSMDLKHCGAVTSNITGKSIPLKFVPITKGPLAVLLTWQGAQDKHIQKYEDIWLQKGFDVLIMKTKTKIQVALPTRGQGTHKLVQDLIYILNEIIPIYPDMIFHCLSIGCFEWIEMFRQLNHLELKDRAEIKRAIDGAVRGAILDSPVAVNEVPRGLSSSISGNNFGAKILEAIFNLYMFMAYPIVTKHYNMAETFVQSKFFPMTPVLFFCSKNDPFGNVEMFSKLEKNWNEAGVDFTFKIYDAGHVKHFVRYPNEYKREIDVFLTKLKLGN